MNSDRFEILEAIRGFAAIYVVFFHILPQKIYLFGINIGLLFRFGSEAVIVFFLLSGFVIRYSFHNYTDKSFQNFFKRRFVRLYVPLIFIFLLGYLVKSIQEGTLTDPKWTSLLGNIFMLQDVISLKPNVISETYLGNGVLWSLSYEWWFYMIFFFLMTYISEKNRNKWIYTLMIISAFTYLMYPFIVNRIITYFATFWIGVIFAEIHLKKQPYTFKAIRPLTYVLGCILLILGLNLYLNFSYTKIYDYPLVAYPFIEVRHLLAAFLFMFAAIIWNKFQWFGFDIIFGKFKYFAPFSYAIYISHHYLVVEATYLKFLNNKIIEYAIYILVMLLFSYVLEILIYEKIKQKLIKNNSIP